MLRQKEKRFYTHFRHVLLVFDGQNFVSLDVSAVIFPCPSDANFCGDKDKNDDTNPRKEEVLELANERIRQKNKDMIHIELKKNRLKHYSLSVRIRKIQGRIPS